MASIVIYDSGVGGLSIYQDVVSQCSNHEFVFVSDNQAFPYGTKAEPELVKRVLAVSQTIAERYHPDVLVVACNTASTVVLPLLRQKFDFDVVGVVPAIKPAAQLSQTKTIGLLATPATVNRDYTKNLIAQFAADCELISLGSSELVQLAEDKLYGKAIDYDQLATILEPVFKVDRLDTLILACTHFPLLRTEIEQLAAASGKSIRLVDSGPAIARRVQQLLQGRNLGERVTARVIDLRASETPSSTTKVAAFTQPIGHSKILSSLEYLGFEKIEHLTV